MSNHTPKASSKVRAGGTTAKNHRFESFSQRIARLKIDPIHHVRNNALATFHHTQESNFRACLDHWKDLNVTKTFAEFYRTASPLCESLPQLLYHADTIYKLLSEYVGKKDVLSAEPLLDLLAEFAHDLGSRFEKYFLEVVSLVSLVAATHQAPEVIECSFTCLAWIYKFLSRLLVPDLRPLFTVLLPYLGDSRHKPYLTRFTAESVVYLMRKAASRYENNCAPLEGAVSFLLKALANVQTEEERKSLSTSLMTLFSESITGIDGDLHSSGPSLFRCLLIESGEDVNTSSVGIPVIRGTLINLVHKSNAKGFLPITQTIWRHCSEIHGPYRNQMPCLVELALVLVTTRKGSRIENWKASHESVVMILDALPKYPQISHDLHKRIQVLIAQSIVASPISELLPSLNKYVNTMLSEPFSDDFLVFVHLVADLDRERFQNFLSSPFQQFVRSHWQDKPAALCYLVRQLQDFESLKSRNGCSLLDDVPSAWQDWMLRNIESEATTMAEKALQDTILHNFNVLSPPISLSTRFSCILHRKIERALASGSCRSLENEFAMGQVLRAYAREATKLATLDADLYNPLIDIAPRWDDHFPFLEGLTEYLTARSQRNGMREEQREPLATKLAANLLRPEQRLRLSSLKLLRRLYSDDGNNAIYSTLSAAIDILGMPYNLNTIREISMMLRRLPTLQKIVDQRFAAYQVIPYLCLGMLTSNVPQLSDIICQVLATLCEERITENLVATVVLSWLSADPQCRPSKKDTAPEIADSRVHESLTQFQCSNLEHTEKVAASRYLEYNDIDGSIVNAFEAEKFEPIIASTTSRSVALRILSAIPSIAEKRSKSVVPLLLSSIYGDPPALGQNGPQAETGLHNETNNVYSWISFDKKAILQVFSQFVNPKALYRSSDVYHSFLHCLTTGDSATQKLALRAIATWKSPALKPYQEELTHLADTAKYRDQLTKLFKDDVEGSFIQEEHREEVAPIILRVLYGQMLSKGGARGSRGDLEDKRKATLRTIFRMRNDEIQQFLSIALGPLSDIYISKDVTSTNINLRQELLSKQQQHGLLNMVLSILETQKAQVALYGERLLKATLYCLLQASWILTPHGGDAAEHGKEPESLIRRNRRTGLQCLNLLFKTCPDIDWERYLPLIFSEFISPRLNDFPIETAQGISGLLQLFATWASSPTYFTFLANYETSLLDVLIDCALVPYAQDSVKVFILDQIFETLAKGLRFCSQEPEDAAVSKSTHSSETVLSPHMDHILTQLAHLIEQAGNPALLNSSVSTLCSLTHFAKTPSVATKVLLIIPGLLSQNSQRINFKTKTFLLLAMRNLLSVPLLSMQPHLRRIIFESVSLSFGHLKVHSTRTVLCEILTRIAETPIDAKIAEICFNLNAQSTARLDSIDYDRRLGAFSAINETVSDLIVSEQWLPVVQNLVFFAKNAEDFAIRSNTVATLKYYIDSESATYDESGVNLMRTVLIPALMKGVKEKSETIRADHVGLMGRLVSKRPDWPELSDMLGLLANNDEEASFFNNILHIQQHRRLRAIRRLIGEVEEGRLGSSNIALFFLPLLEGFIFDQENDEKSHNLIGQSIEGIGVLLKWVEWRQFRAIFLKFKNNMLREDHAEKHTVKLVTTAANALHQAISSKLQAEFPNEDRSDASLSPPNSRLSLSLPPRDKIADELMKHIISDLSAFVHHKDETQLSFRVPIAIAVGKMVIALDASQYALILPPLFLDIAYILRSRSQDSRDTARRTLSELVEILGPSCLSFVIKELRTALARGYQLHVLSYTVHSILVSNEQRIQPGDLNECLKSLVAIVIDDIFGVVGQEKDAEEYTSKMKEVKSSKSFDSMELLAKSITISRLIELIDPLRSLMTTGLTSKQSRQADELFRRIDIGLTRNPAAGTRDMLVLIYQLIQSSYIHHTFTDSGSSSTKQGNDHLSFAPASSAHRPLGGRSDPVPHKLMRFALDIIRSTLQKHEALCTAENLHGFIPIIGDALMQSYDEVKISALRLLSTIIKLPLKEIDDNAKLFITEAVKVVKESVSTSSEAAQAALKLLASYLRERREVTISESDLAYILHRIMPDIEEPDRQGVTFNFVKAIMARRFALPEIYELMDKVAVMMVTNHSRNARDVARGAYVHFLLEYPQAKSRWAKQIKFLVKNLEYEHTEGRQSVMEAINTLFSRCRGEVADEITGALFIPLVLLMSNNESTSCREMAAALLGLFFQKSTDERLKVLMSPIRSWLQKHENPALLTAGMQVYSVFFGTSTVGKRSEALFVRSCLFDAIRTQVVIEDEDSWEAIYNTLQLLSKICAFDPEKIMRQEYADEWSSIGTLLNHLHPWVQAVTADLYGKLFHDLARINTNDGLGSMPLVASGGLQFDEAMMFDALCLSVSVLQKNRVNKDLSSQTVRNLIFLGRCFKDNNLTIPTAKKSVNSQPEVTADDFESEETEGLAFHHLLHQAVVTLRTEFSSHKASGLLPRMSALQLLAGLCHHADVGLLKPFLQDILLPLQHLTDPSTPIPSSLNEEFRKSYKELVTGSHELLDSLQKKLGSTEYIAQMSEAQKTIRERREDRRTKRKIEAVANPEKYGKDKRKKADRKKTRNKEKSMEFRSRRRGW